MTYELGLVAGDNAELIFELGLRKALQPTLRNFLFSFLYVLIEGLVSGVVDTKMNSLLSMSPESSAELFRVMHEWVTGKLS